MPRPRRAAAPTSFVEPSDQLDSLDPSENGEQADAEFLALSAHQRSAIDRAFERGLKAVGKKQRREEKRDRKRKRRETAVVDLTEDGGFLDDGGGFVDDDVGEGGFIDGGDIAGGGFVDDDNAGGFVEEDDMGAFVADEDTTNDPTPAGPSASMSRRDSPSAAQRIPLYILPGILTSLGLPADDDVLAVFRASASGWADGEEEETPGGRRPQVGDGEQESGGVELKDFRAVCAALMGPDEGNEDGDEDLEKRSDQAFEMESSSSLSSLPDSGDDYGQASETSRGKGKGKAVAGASLRRGKKKVDPDLEEMAQIRLSAGQKEMVKSLWEMVKPNATGRGANILGREEVKGFARGLSEMWSEEEITEMVSLFSTQHEGRGLSYDDFGKVMFRAGLV